MPLESMLPTGESEPSVSRWMNTLPSIEDSPAAAAASAPPATEQPKPPAVAPADTTPPAADKADEQPPAADPKPAAKAAEEPPKADAAEDPEEKWPRSGDDWKRFKAKNKEKEQKYQAEIKARESKLSEYDSKLKGMETELAELRSKAGAKTPEEAAEIEKLRKDVEDYSKRLAVAEVTSHPKFIAYFKNKVDEQVDLAKDIVGEEMAENVAKVLTMTDGDSKRARIEEIVTDLSPIQQAQFGSVMNELRRIDRERQSEIAKAQENRTKMLAEQKTVAEQRANEGKKLFQTTLKSMQDAKEGIAVYQQRENDAQWNAMVKANIAEAERILFGAQDKKPEDFARAALHAAAFPMILKSYKEDMQERDTQIASLKAQVAKLSAAQPSTGGTAQAGTEAAKQTVKVSRSMSPMEASAAWVKSLQPND